MLSFPCVLFKEKHATYSKEELQDKIVEGQQLGKICLVSCYGFYLWENGYPIKESVILDKIVYVGSKENLELIAETKLCNNVESVLVFDGEQHLLFCKEPLESLDSYKCSIGNLAELDTMFVIPKCVNYKTGLTSKIVKVWKQ